MKDCETRRSEEKLKGQDIVVWTKEVTQGSVICLKLFGGLSYEIRFRHLNDHYR